VTDSERLALRREWYRLTAEMERVQVELELSNGGDAETLHRLLEEKLQLARARLALPVEAWPEVGDGLATLARGEGR